MWKTWNCFSVLYQSLGHATILCRYIHNIQFYVRFHDNFSVQNLLFFFRPGSVNCLPPSQNLFGTVFVDQFQLNFLDVFLVKNKGHLVNQMFKRNGHFEVGNRSYTQLKAASDRKKWALVICHPLTELPSMFFSQAFWASKFTRKNTGFRERLYVGNVGWTLKMII